jgi:uncharacterized protein (TIGR02147 family)
VISVYEYQNYRTFLAKRFGEMPKRGYGQAKKLADYLGVHTTLVSQVFKELKSFTPEQACNVAEFLGLNDLETEYFVLLVQADRAGNEALRKVVQKRIETIRTNALELENRLQSKKNLTPEQQAIFYSDWTYSAVRQLTAIPGFDTAGKIAEQLGLSLKKVNGALDFLLNVGLCVETKGKIKIGPSSTHLGSSSPWVKTHHMNWRNKAIEKLNHDQKDSLHYTCPLTISKSDALKIREQIVKMLESLDKIIEPSPSEELHCLNIDWFKI